MTLHMTSTVSFINDGYNFLMRSNTQGCYYSIWTDCSGYTSTHTIYKQTDINQSNMTPKIPNLKLSSGHNMPLFGLGTWKVRRLDGNVIVEVRYFCIDWLKCMVIHYIT